MSITNRITGDQKISGFVNIYNQNNENIENALKEYKDDYKKLDSEIKGNVNKSKVVFDVMVNKLSPLKVSDSEADLRKSFYETLELYKKSGNIETEYRDKIERWRTIGSTKGLLDKGYATRGGVDTREIDSKTMESRLVNGLYVIGEALDVDGECGGYNLTFAFASAYSAFLSLTGKKA